MVVTAVVVRNGRVKVRKGLRLGLCGRRSIVVTHARLLGEGRYCAFFGGMMRDCESLSVVTSTARRGGSWRRRAQDGGEGTVENGEETMLRDRLLANEEEGSSAEAGKPDSEEPTRTITSMTVLAFLFPALGGMLFGYDIGSTSGALVSLTSSAVSGTAWGPALSTSASAFVVSSSLFGALLGSALALFVGNAIGRKKEMQAAAVFYAVSAAIYLATTSYGLLVVGRLLYGIGIGFSMHAAPMYIAETAPSSIRGTLISLKEGLIVGGILLGYLSSYLLINSIGGWRFMYGLALPIATVFLLGVSWLPRSPRWLLLSGAPKEEVKESLFRLRGVSKERGQGVEESLEAQVNEMETSLTAEKGSNGAGGMSALLEKKSIKALVIGLSLIIFQQITGQPSVLYYAAKIFQDAGFQGAEEATSISVWLGLFKLIMTAVAVRYVDSAGRRPLLLAGASAMVISLIILGSNALSGSVGAAWVSVAALLSYVGAYQVSFGPISWLMVGEIFPLAVRGQAVALATLANFGSNAIVSQLLPGVQSALGQGYTYFLFAGFGALAVATIYAIVPETKGKSLEEIQDLLDD